MLSAVRSREGQGRRVKSTFCQRRHISLADLDKLIDTFSELTGYALGVLPWDQHASLTVGPLQQRDACVCVPVCVCGDEACGAVQSPAVSESPKGSFVTATQHPP